MNNDKALSKHQVLGKPISIAIPPGVSRLQVAPLRGQEMAQAKLSYKQVQEKLPRAFPNSLEKPENKISDDVRLQIEQLYARGRALFARKKFVKSKKCFQKALKLAPYSPPILHMLGILSFNLGDARSGADYLEQSLGAGGKHITSFMLLGRYALKKGNWNKAAGLFGSALNWYRSLPEAQPYVLAVLHYDLALSLHRSGFISAALDQYQLYFKIPRTAPFGYNRLYIQLVYTDKQKALTYETMGDLYNQIQEPSQALQCYQNAVKQAGDIKEDLLLKIIYTQLVLGKYHSAVDTALEKLQDQYHTSKTPAGDFLVPVKYVASQLPNPGYFVTQLTKVYKQVGRPVVLAILIASQLSDHKAIDFLTSQLQSGRQSDKLFRILIDNYLLPDHIKKAVLITAKQMRRSAGHSNDYLGILVDHSNPDRLTEITTGLANDRDRLYPYLLTIKAGGQVKQEDFYKAAQTYKRAVSFQRDLTVARMNLARTQLRLYAPKRALQALEPLKNSSDFDVIQLRVKALVAADQRIQALKLANGFSAQNKSVDVILEQAHLFSIAGDYKKSIQILNDAIDKRPGNQKLYAALFKIYNYSFYGKNPLQGYQQLIKKAVLNIPGSRIIRLQIARINATRGKNKRAQAILYDLLSNDSEDITAVRLLIGLQEKNSHHNKAVDVLNQVIAAHPENQAIYHLAQQFYLHTLDQVHLIDVSQKLINIHPNHTENILKTAQFYFRAKAYQSAVNLIESAFKNNHKRIYRPQNFVSILWRCLVRLDKSSLVESRIEKIVSQFPKHKTKLYYQLAMFQAAQGKQDQSITILKKILKKSSEYADANNALGYALSKEERDLAHARALVNRALSQSPKNPAYLDSWGWVLYQQGQYTKALLLFKKIMAGGDIDNPIVLGHYGAVLYAGGDKTKAIQIWEKALDIYRRHYSDPTDAEMIHLGKRLKKNIDQAKGSAVQLQ